MELTIGLAFIAGLLSFISPCVLPLVPAYVGYMGGRLTNRVGTALRADVSSSHMSNSTAGHARFSTFIHGLFFVAGFTLVFVAIGLLSTALIQQIGGENINLFTDIIGRVGGVVIVFFGLHFTGVIPSTFARLRAHETVIDNVLTSVLVALLGGILISWSFTGTVALWNSSLWGSALGIPIVATLLLTAFLLWLILGGAFTTPGSFWKKTINTVENALYSDTRRQLTASGRGGYGGSFAMGVVFSAGWTPCIGPVYGAVLTIAANGGDIRQAGVLLVAYSLGLGIPFLFTALMLDGTQNILRRLQRHMRMIELASGVFLIVIGLTVASGQLQSLSQQFAGQFAEFSVRLEESVIGVVTDVNTTGRSGQTAATAPEQGSIGTGTNTAAEAVDRPSEGIAVGLDVGNLAPDFSTVTDTGEPISLSDLRGKVVVLNFWATWCGPCRIEMPVFQEEFARRANDSFTILAVNNREKTADVIGFRQELGLTFPLVMDEHGEIQDRYAIFSYPSTFVLDRNGVIIARHFGALTREQINELLDQALTA